QKAGTVRTTAIRALGLLLFSLAAASPAAFGQLPLGARSNDAWTIAPMLKEVMPAVVNIQVESRVPVRTNPLLEDPFFRRFFGIPDIPETRRRQSVGSGVIVDAENGYILTNHHVVSNATAIIVTLHDQRQLEAELIGSDEATDIALLRIEADGLTDVPMGDSSQLEVGDFVVAIGNPFGLGQTVTSGIVSALGRRTNILREGYEDFIQTDAPINPGNSGGALITMDGLLVGINTAIVSPAGGNVGIGFAVPTNMARAVMEQLIEYGEVSRGRLGVHIQTVTPQLAQALDLKVERGALITQVEPGSSAEEAGLQPGDVIIAVDGAEVRDVNDLTLRIGRMRVGTPVRIGYARDGERRARRGSCAAQRRSPGRAVGKRRRGPGGERRPVEPRGAGGARGRGRARRREPERGPLRQRSVAAASIGGPAGRGRAARDARQPAAVHRALIRADADARPGGAAAAASARAARPRRRADAGGPGGYSALGAPAPSEPMNRLEPSGR